MRLTPLRQAMLAFLATQRMPVSLEMIAQADGVRGQCDATTVYRTQALFKAADIVRQVGTPAQISLFLLNVPDETRQFLICRRCGCIKEMAVPGQKVESLRRTVVAQGFSPSGQDCDYELGPDDDYKGKPQTWRRASQVPKPAAAILFAENNSSADHIMPHFWIVPSDAEDVDSNRHRPKANYAFADGHSQLLLFARTYAPQHVDLWNLSLAQ